MESGTLQHLIELLLPDLHLHHSLTVHRHLSTPMHHLQLLRLQPRVHQYLLRELKHLRHKQPVTLIHLPRLHLVQHGQLPLLHHRSHEVVRDPLRLLRQLSHLVKVRREQPVTPDSLAQVLSDGPRQSEPVARRSPSAQLVHYHKGVPIGRLHHVTRLQHLTHESGDASQLYVRCTHSRDYRVDYLELSRRASHETPYVSQKHVQCHLSDESRLPSHVSK